MSTPRSTAAALLFALPLVAQTTATAPAPHVLIDTVGPDGWRVRLGPTNLGSLLASEKGRELWQPEVDPYLGWWRQITGDETAFAAAREGVLGYGGRIRIGAWLDGRHGIRQMVAILESDGRTDMKNIAAEIRRLQQQADGEWAKADVAGEQVELRCHGDDAMTAPIQHGSCVVVAMAQRDTIAEALGLARSLASDATDKAPAPSTPALRLQIEGRALVATADASTAVARALGLDSLGTTTLTIGSAGPHVQVEVAQTFTSDDRGLFGALFPSAQGVPALARLRTGKGAWKVGRFDAMALWKAVEALFATEDVGQPNVRQDVRDEIGCDIVDDLLAYLTDEVLVDVAPLDDPERVSRTPWTIVIRVTDQAKLEPGLEAVLANANPMLTRKDTIEHAGGELRRYGNMFGYDLWVALGQGLFAIGGGADTEDRLKALFDAAKAAPASEEPRGPAGFEGLQRHMPPGCNGLGQGEIDSIVGIPLGLWLVGAGAFVRGAPGVVEDPEVRERWLALVREHHLDTVRTASGYADRRWSWRLFW